MVHLYEIPSDFSIDFLETYSANLATTPIVLDAALPGITISLVTDSSLLVFPAFVKGQIFVRNRVILFVRQIVDSVQTVLIGIEPCISPYGPEAGIPLPSRQSDFITFNPTLQRE